MNAMEVGLNAEYAAIYAYGAYSHYLGGPTADMAEAIEEQHRQRRDRLLVWFAENDAQPPTPQPAYELDQAQDGTDAVAALMATEEAVATAWRSVVHTDEVDQRKICVEMLCAAASTLVRWRVAAGEIPTQPWPGRP
ncbi:DUF4439 domain-containing protein [Natronoglycomyces albus]|uniref:DUF4439 domain-containing protein n=1 Tax=Natronoglycomyces albus TaxID=2811108 RepID=A0A895XRA3_9ACTN|nr:DUF4439 domain-containing protein [Natronoglycomyces albus]QSB06242.1 DUF4439 domain-containing protein [Natronoglycomyces albus]